MGSSRAADRTALAGAAVVVAGAGVTGRSVVAALVDAGAWVTVTDADSDRLAGLEHTGVTLRPGLTAPPDGTDLVVTSPGWRPTSPLLVAAAAAGVEVIGDVELAWRIGALAASPPVWLAVTGTNGKTTTVGMLEAMLRAAGVNAVACGNVGFAVLDAVTAQYDVLAVELSSFQLHWSASLAPRAAVVLNVAEDHLDWHGDYAAYAAAKGTVYTATGTAVFNADEPVTGRLAAEHAAPTAARVGFRAGEPAAGELGVVDGQLVDAAFGEQPVALAATEVVRPPGPHNIANALAAAALARSYGVPAEAVDRGLRDCTPAQHRATIVAEVGGVTYVNDSKATNPHAAAGSLTSYDSIVWIAGGLLKGAEVGDLVRQIAGRLRAAVLLGADAAVIAAALAEHAPDVAVVGIETQDEPMAAAVDAAADLAQAGDAVVLAPAAASMDMFVDYAARGAAFTDAVQRLGR